MLWSSFSLFLHYHSPMYNVPRFMTCRMQDAAPRAHTPPVTRTRLNLGRYVTNLCTSPRGRIGTMLKPRVGPRQNSFSSAEVHLTRAKHNIVPPRGRLKYTTRSLSLLMIGPRTPELRACHGGYFVLRTAAKSRRKPLGYERTSL